MQESRSLHGPMLYIDLRPGQKCHSKDGGSDTFRWPVMGRNRVGGLGWQYGTGLKYHGTVRLIHRKRVTCELHDSYFCLMTIKHAIPKTAEVTHSDGQLWGDIEWAIELLYNSVKSGSQLVWRPNLLVTRCGRESQYPAEWVPRPLVEPHRRTGKKRGYGQ